MVVHMTWVWTFFNNYSNHPRMCVLSTLCGNVDKHSPFDIYIYIYIYIYIKNDFSLHWAYSPATLRKIRKIATFDISRLQWNDLDIATCNPNQLCTIIEFNRPYIIDHNILHLYRVPACDFPKPFRRLKVHMKMSDQQRNYIFKSMLM